jgi:BlaI family penicillinase repressor
MQITAAESRVMEPLWDRGPMGSEDLVAAVLSREAWGSATVKTLINRLRRKKAIQSRRAGGRLTYHPLLNRADYVEVESQDLLDRLFGGELTPLVSHFAERKKLSPEDAARLRILIDRLEDR